MQKNVCWDSCLFSFFHFSQQKIYKAKARILGTGSLLFWSLYKRAKSSLYQIGSELVSLLSGTEDSLFILYSTIGALIFHFFAPFSCQSDFLRLQKTLIWPPV
jgi:hypothetical protein